MKMRYFLIAPISLSAGVRRYTLSSWSDLNPDGANRSLVHGRLGTRPTRWLNRAHPMPHGQQTWTRAEQGLRTCLEGSPQEILAAPLGRGAAIVDAVPWKFRNWRGVPEDLRDALIQAGRRYLGATLNEHIPAVIVATGEHVRRLMHTIYPGVPAFEAGPPQDGLIDIGGQQVRWFGVVAPTGGRGRRFYDEMARIAPRIQEALHLEVPPTVDQAA